MTTLLQVSDPHFGTEQPPVVDALLQFTREHPPDVLVLSGDITQRARRRQFEAARRFVDLVAPPVALVIPGNHDIPLFNLFARVLAPYKGYCRAFGHDLEPMHAMPGLLVVGVNTTRPRRHKNGEVSSVQVERIARHLRDATPSQLRVVVVHQPVMASRADDVKNLLRGRAQAVPAWVDAGADLIMGGHIHWPYVCSLRLDYRDLRRDAWVVQAGTALSSRVRDGVPNSVNVVRREGDAEPRRCTVERWDFEASSRRFELREVHDLSFSSPRGVHA